MPLLDVSEVLDDPLFADTLVCTRNTQILTAGVASVATVDTPFSGVVTSAAGLDLMRQAQGEQIHGTITIHSRFRLSDGSPGITADIVTWNGAQYTVTNIADYSRYGAGFICATAELIPLAGS